MNDCSVRVAHSRTPSQPVSPIGRDVQEPTSLQTINDACVPLLAIPALRAARHVQTWRLPPPSKHASHEAAAAAAAAASTAAGFARSAACRHPWRLTPEGTDFAFCRFLCGQASRGPTGRSYVNVQLGSRVGIAARPIGSRHVTAALSAAPLENSHQPPEQPPNRQLTYRDPTLCTSSQAPASSWMPSENAPVQYMYICCVTLLSPSSLFSLREQWSDMAQGRFQGVHVDYVARTYTQRPRPTKPPALSQIWWRDAIRETISRASACDTQTPSSLTSTRCEAIRKKPSNLSIQTRSQVRICISALPSTRPL